MSRHCGMCGAPLTGGRFCTLCGASASAGVVDETAGPRPVPGNGSEQAVRMNPGRRAWAALAVAAVVVGGAVVTFVIVRSGQPSSTPTAGASQSSVVATTAGDGPSTAANGRQQVSASSTTSTGGNSSGASKASTSTSSASPVPFSPVPVAVAADCSSLPSQDAAGTPQTYEPTKAFDGKSSTAWRCDGDAVGHGLMIDFGGPVRLTAVGLMPGFDKIDPLDGADRFFQGRRVIRVRWTFSDGSTVEAAPNGQRSMQSTTVAVRTSRVWLTILETAPGSTVVTNTGEELAPVDISAVSEVSFAGLR